MKGVTDYRSFLPSERSFVILFLTALPVSVIFVGGLYFYGPTMDTFGLGLIVFMLLSLCEMLDEADRHHIRPGVRWDVYDHATVFSVGTGGIRSTWVARSNPATKVVRVYSAGQVDVVVNYGTPEISVLPLFVITSTKNEFDYFVNHERPDLRDRAIYLPQGDARKGMLGVNEAEYTRWGRWWDRGDLRELQALIDTLGFSLMDDGPWP